MALLDPKDEAMKSLFDEVEELEIPEEPEELPIKASAAIGDMKPRDYQERVIGKVIERLRTDRSTLYVMATGTGKTVTFGHIAKPFIEHGRVLILAHRQELIYQAQRTLKKILGFEPEIEMGDQWADSGRKVICSTVQTQHGARGGRKERFDPKDFSLVIVDEAHHGTADSYRAILAHYMQNPNLKVVGCTATPDRSDEEALGQIFESVADEYELPDAIRDGWLVHPETRQVFVESLDFSKIRTTAGDLNGADLAAVMETESNLHAIADPLVKLAGDRQTLVFTASVAQAERLSEILNRHRQDCSQFVYGKTDDDTRARMLFDFQDRKFQYLVNCAIATEGWDCPPVEVIAMARPTKSRALYSQMVGRGTRVLPEVGVDAIPTAAGRRAAIAASRKPMVEVIDWVGNTGRHQLVSMLDILGGRYPEEVLERAKKDAPEDGEMADPEERLQRAQKAIEDEEARRAEAAKRAVVIGTAHFTSSVNKPFAVLGIEVRSRGWDKGASPEQIAFLERAKFDTKGLTAAAAQAMIGEIQRRRRAKLATVKQAAILKRNGFSADMSFERANKIITVLAGNRWQWPKGMEIPE